MAILFAANPLLVGPSSVFSRLFCSSLSSFLRPLLLIASSFALGAGFSSWSGANDAGVFVPDDADWSFDARRVTAEDVRAWNDNASRYSFTNVDQYIVLNSGLCVRFKNLANRPRLTPHAGYIRAVRDREETGDLETINSAHQWIYPCVQENIEKFFYHREYEVGFKFMVPAPDDADIEAFQPEFFWIWSLPTSSGPTGGVYGLSLGGWRVDLIHRYIKDGERQKLYRHVLLPRWRPNVWYYVRARFVASNEPARKGWIEILVYGDGERRTLRLDNVLSGKETDKYFHQVLGQYSAYKIGGYRRTIYFDQWYYKRLSDGW